MALANTLNTNEIKNAAGTEVEFQRLRTGDWNAEFAVITESPAFPYRMKISHQEIGSGASKRRRSNITFKTVTTGQIDTTKLKQDSCSLTLDRMIGNENDSGAVAKALIANMLSFVGTTGAGTTVLFDCSGTGASNLLSGGI
jgi:hypothetical protein